MAELNGYQGQLRAADQPTGKFKAREDLYPQIVSQSNMSLLGGGIKGVVKFGVYAPPTTIIYLNNEPFEIGKTYMLEESDVMITSIYFAKDTDNNVVIDYIIEGLL